MLSREDNELLTRVGPGTAMGDHDAPLLDPRAPARWELPEPDGPPVRVRLLGEDLVAFRDTRAARPARRVLPASARVALLRAQRGLRPALRLPRLEVRRRRPVRRHDERAGGARFAHKIRTTAYPTGAGRRRLGLHGPARAQPAPPQFAWTQAPDDAPPRVEGDPGVQLAAGAGGRHRHLARADHAPPDHENSHAARVQADEPVRARQGADPGRRPHRLRLPVRGHPAAGRSARPRPHVPLHPAVPPDPARRGRSGGLPLVAGHIWVPMDDDNTMVYNWVYSATDGPLTEEDRLERGSATARRRRPDDVPLASNRREQLPARPPGAEDRELHRHRRHQRPGPRDPGEHGPRSSTAAASTWARPTRRSSRPGACSWTPCARCRTAARRAACPRTTRCAPTRACCPATPTGGRRWSRRTRAGDRPDAIALERRPRLRAPCRAPGAGTRTRRDRASVSRAGAPRPGLRIVSRRAARRLPLLQPLRRGRRGSVIADPAFRLAARLHARPLAERILTPASRWRASASRSPCSSPT